ncbi:MAG: MFS transporter [Chloroflexi bacterium]|nr:MFS transporter [Chloroflexota bacterium]
MAIAQPQTDSQSVAAPTATAEVLTPTVTQPFDPVAVITLAGGHLIHDGFASFLSPLLPLIIQKLGLSLTMAGSLAALQSLPSLINPFLGMIGDRISLRWLAVAAPTVTAVAMTLVGAAPTYTALAILLVVAGVGSACWHVPTPVMAARAAGQRVGLSMSILMLGGELSRSLGPLLAVGAVSLWGLEGMWRLMPLGLAASLVLFWRTRGLVVRPAHKAGGSWAETWHDLRRVVLPIAGIIGTRTFLSVALATYLPTLLTREGLDIVQAGSAFSVLMFAGAVGSFTTGTISDRVGRRRVLLTVLTGGPLLMGVFLSVQGWVTLPVLFAMGCMALSTSPVLMALVQEYGSHHPATANGIYMALEFVGGSIITVIVGVLADAFGLRAAFGLSALIAICGVPFVLLLPRQRMSRR